MDPFFLMCVGMTATFIGTIAGRGGLINFPAMLLLGTDPLCRRSERVFPMYLSCPLSTFFNVICREKDFMKVVIVPFPVLGGVTGGLFASALSEAVMTVVAIVLLSCVVLLTFIKKPAPSSTATGDMTISKKMLPGLYAVGGMKGCSSLDRGRCNSRTYDVECCASAGCRSVLRGTARYPGSTWLVPPARETPVANGDNTACPTIDTLYKGGRERWKLR